MKKLLHLYRNFYLGSLVQQARMAYQDGAGGAGGGGNGAGGEKPDNGTEKKEDADKPGDVKEKIVKLQGETDALKTKIAAYKENANDKIKALATDADTKITDIETKSDADTLTEDVKTATLTAVEGILKEAAARESYEGDRQRNVDNATKQKGDVSKFIKGLLPDEITANLSQGVKDKLQGINAVLVKDQDAFYDKQIADANALDYDKDDKGAAMKDIQKNLLSEDYRIVADDFTRTRDTEIALDAANMDQDKLIGQVNAEGAQAKTEVSPDQDQGAIDAANSKIDGVVAQAATDLAALKGPDQKLQRAQAFAKFKDALRAISSPEIPATARSTERDVDRKLLDPQALVDAKAKVDTLRNESGKMQQEAGAKKGSHSANDLNKAYTAFTDQQKYVKQLEAFQKTLKDKYKDNGGNVPNDVPVEAPKEPEVKGLEGVADVVTPIAPDDVKEALKGVQIVNGSGEVALQGAQFKVTKTDTGYTIMANDNPNLGLSGDLKSDDPNFDQQMAEALNRARDKKPVVETPKGPLASNEPKDEEE